MWKKESIHGLEEILLKKALLDCFLISESLFAEVDESCIYPGYRTDHSMIMMQLQLGKFRKGRSYWKMNNSLLKYKIRNEIL